MTADDFPPGALNGITEVDDRPRFEDRAAAAVLLQRIENAGEVARTPIEPIPFDIEGILPAVDAPALMFGPPGSLKSWLAIAMCDAIVKGEPFLGFRTRQRERALYLNLDAGKVTFRNRMRASCDAQGVSFLSLGAREFEMSFLRPLLDRYRGAFVVVDCLASIYAPDMSNDPAHAMRTFVDDLRTVYAEADCGGVVIDHPHRPKERGELGDYHGSIQKEAAFRTMWSIVAEAPDEANPHRQVKIACRKLSEGAPFAPISAEVRFGERVTIARALAPDPLERVSIIKDHILAYARAQTEAFSKNRIENAIHGHRAADIRRGLNALISRGILVPSGIKNRGADLYKLAEIADLVRVPDEVGRGGRGGAPTSSQSSSPVGDGDDVGSPDGVHDIHELTNL